MENEPKGIYDKQEYYPNKGQDFFALGGTPTKIKGAEEKYFMGIIEDKCVNCGDVIRYFSNEGTWWHKWTNSKFMKRCIWNCNNLHRHKIKDRIRCKKPIASKEALENLRILSLNYPNIKVKPLNRIPPPTKVGGFLRVNYDEPNHLHPIQKSNQA